MLIEASDLARRIGQQERLCGALANLAALSIESNQLSKAEHYVREGLAVAEAINQAQRLLALRVLHVRVLRLQGDFTNKAMLLQHAPMLKKAYASVR